MEVNKISATIRYSQNTGKGSWKVVELGAEASISDREFWQQAQSELYYQLTHQLRTLWSNGNGTTLNGNNGIESPLEPLPELEPTPTPPAHWCDRHKAEFRRQEKDGTVWYSHRQGSAWCSEA